MKPYNTTLADPEGVTGGLDLPEKSQVTTGFLRNSGTDTPISRSDWNHRVQLLLEEGPYGPL